MGDVLPNGTIVDGYRIERPLGWGGAAVVYEATDLHLERSVALKVMLPHVNADPVFRKRFKREGWIHSNLTHPNIVTVYDGDDNEEHGFWIAMMLMKGGSLEARLKKPVPLDPEQTIALLGPIAAALDFAHAEGHIHRDVKPENILLNEDGVASLTDFGIAKSVNSSRLTRTGQGVGTPGYMAPEQIQGKGVTGRADVYALAVVLFKCLTGELPLPRAAGISRGRLRITNDIPNASERNPKLPEAIDAVIRQGMATQPKRRHPKASVLIDDARRALADGAVRRLGASAGWLPKGPRRAIVAGAVSVFALGVIGLGLGAATAGAPRLHLVRVTTGDLELSTPPDWIEHKGHSAVPGLGISEPVSLELPLGPSGQRLAISAGLSRVSGASLLAPAYRAQLKGDTRRVPVALGSLSAYRYTLEAPKIGAPVAVFVAPTTHGVATLACLMPRKGDEQVSARLCSRVASTLALRRGVAYPLGPSPAFAKALRLRFARLTERRALDLGRLTRADSAEEQAVAAADIADAFRGAARGLAAAQLSPEISPIRTRLVASLHLMHDAYRDLAIAAREEDEAQYASAVAAAEAGEKAVSSDLANLRVLGNRS